MSKSKKLTKIKFFSISRDIRDGRRTNAQMADFHGVSIETIRTVRHAKTWKGFLAHKELKAAKALKRKIALGKARATMNAPRLPLNIGTNTEDSAKALASAFNRAPLQEQIDGLREDFETLAGHVATIEKPRGFFRRKR